METLSLLEAFEQSNLAGKRALLKANKPPEGFSEQYFLRVAKLLSENPKAAQDLAEGWGVVKRYGDDISFAWRSKGALDRIKGDWVSSAKAFILAGSHAKSLVDQISFQVGAIDSLARAGKTESAVKLGRSISEQLEAMGEKALAGRAWLNTGNANLWADHFKDAQSCFDRAYGCLKGTQFKLEAASARLGASSSALYIDIPSKSLSLAELARDEMSAIGAQVHSNHAQVNVGQCHLMMGEADESVRIFSDLRSLVSPESLEYARLGQFLGDAWLALQVYETAGDAFESALASKGMRQSPLNQGNALVGMGDVRLFQGRAKEAKDYYQKASRTYLKFGSGALNNLAQIGIARSEIALNKYSAAKRILKLTIVDLRNRKMFHYLVGALLDLAAISRSNIDLIKEAQRIIRKHGFISEAWRIHSILAETSKDSKTALKEYRRMVNAILNHRARLSSITARTSLVNSSLKSIRNYLGILVEANTKRSISEAMKVISDLRSITLLDEFLLADKGNVVGSAHETLSRIRKEVTSSGGDQLPGGPLRLVGNGVWNKPSLIRTYLEQVGVNRLGVDLHQPSIQSDCPVNTFVFLRNSSAWISPTSSHQLNVSRDDLIKRLRWIYFELMAPLSGFESDQAILEREISTLRSDLAIDLVESGEELLHVSLEDVAYQIPWSLISTKEAVLHLRPGGGISPATCVLDSNPKVGIWYFPRPDLPHIDGEVTRIREMFPNAIVYSTVDQVLNAAESDPFDLIHVAAHGRYDHENPMFSSIQLEDGHLLACDIARSSFQTRIAVLASCDSASMGQPTGWEPQGLARAFLARRSEVVIGSLWPLNDQVAEYGFGVFYRKLKEGLSVSQSLANARDDLKERYPHSAFWGSFVMFGGYKS